MKKYFTKSADETKKLGESLGRKLKAGDIVAMFGTMGMGKTAFTQGILKGMENPAQVYSPTFALVNNYGGNPTVYHFDMYRINTWDDLYSTGFFDYLDGDSVLIIEWSENIKNAIPDYAHRIYFEKGNEDTDRIITSSVDMD